MKHFFSAIATMLALVCANGSANAVQHDNRITASYAHDFALTPQQAQRQLELQRLASDFQAEAANFMPEIYGGLYMEHRPTFRVLVLLTQGGKEMVLPLLEGRFQALGSVLDVAEAKHPLRDLQSLVPTLSAMLERIHERADLDVDVAANTVTINSLDPNRLHRTLTRAGVSLPRAVVLQEVAKLTEPLEGMGGGVSINECTAGFSVVRASDGKRGMTTAAHCDNNLQYYKGTLLPWVAGKYGQDWDVQWHTTSPYIPTNVVWNGTSYVTINAMRGRLGQAVGEYVCKHGRVTRYTCGTIRSTSFLPSTIPNATATWVTVGNMYAEGGDSGAPIFKGNAAYGILHGIYSTGTEWRTVYMAADRIKTGLGVDVLLTP